MQDLTFGEQVKIILSRKDMTIKELAKKIEVRTGKKMSRQNLTQRLGRDNFQEQDMRMIAEILGCPFQLNILDERMITESSPEAGRQAGELTKAAGEPGQAAASGMAVEPGSEQADGKPEEPAETKPLETASVEQAGKEESGTEQKRPEENKQPETVREEAGEILPEKAAQEAAEKAKEPKAMAHERDITIGELVDINEELDALMERATGNLPDKKQVEDNHKEDQKADDARQNDGMYEGPENGQSRAPKHEDEKAAPYINAAGVQDAADTRENYPAGHAGESLDGSQENGRADSLHESVPIPHSAASLNEADRLYQTMYEEGDQESSLAESRADAGGEHIREPLEKTEAIEKTEKTEKPHGLMAYLRNRFKKIGKETVQTGKEAGGSYPEGDGSAGAYEEGYPEGDGSAGAYEEGYPEGDQSAGAYEEGYPEGNQSAGAYCRGYSEEEYPQEGYSAESYEESHFSGEYPVESYGVDEQEEYTARAYVGSYTEMEYSDGTYEEEYQSVEYSEGAYLEAMSQEDEEDRGEINPYTGKEYESNSVRMHPSRIGYVQVYDRMNHEWTDMTEWAFLGYQERKKQLLGKDYDPPIYLD